MPFVPQPLDAADTVPMAPGRWPPQASGGGEAETPAWLVEARAHIGLREIPGANTAPQIERWLVELGAWWRNDEAPWCGVACAGWLRKVGIQPPRAAYRARAWATWGAPLGGPALGAVVVCDGGPTRPGGGHVGLCEGIDRRGRIVLLGGNQNNAVSLAPFARSRVLSYRWPQGVAMSHATLPLLALDAPDSVREG